MRRVPPFAQFHFIVDSLSSFGEGAAHFGFQDLRESLMARALQRLFWGGESSDADYGLMDDQAIRAGEEGDDPCAIRTRLSEQESLGFRDHGDRPLA